MFAGSRLHPGRAFVVLAIACRVMASCLAAELAVPGTVEPPVITSVGALRALSSVEAGQGLPVEVTGVVTYFERKWETLFVQDDTGGTYVFPSGRPRPEVQPGQRVRVRGRTRGGGPRAANAIQEEALEVLGPGVVPFPSPRRKVFSELAAGAADGNWIEIEGVVRVLWAERERMEIDLVVDGGRLRMHLPKAPGAPLPADLLHGRVRARGVCGLALGERGAFLGVRLFTPSLEEVTLLVRPTPAGEIPLRSLAAVAESNPAWVSPARVRVAGVVTFAAPGGPVFLSDETGGMQLALVETRLLIDPSEGTLPAPDPPVLRAGQRIEVLGYPAVRDGRVILEEVEVQVRGVGSLPPEMRPAAEDWTSLGLDARRIACEGRVMHVLPDSGEDPALARFLVQVGDRMLEVWRAGEESAALAPSMRVRLSGVASASVNAFGQVQAWRIWVGAEDGVAVVDRPWVRVGRGTLQLLTGAGLVVLASGGWALFLWRQLGRKALQNAELGNRIAARTRELETTNADLRRLVAERQAVEEQLRLALAREKELGELKSNFVSLVSHEFRTPLEGILSSAEILERYHDRLAPGQRAKQAGAIQKSVRRMAEMMNEVLLLGRFEAGRVEFRPAPVDVLTFQRRMRDEIAAAMGSGTRIELEAAGDLAGALADEKLMGHIFTNLLSNAVKYSAEGGTVRFRVSREGGDAVFQVADMGCGIPDSDRPRLFQSFHRGSNVGHRSGTGLGLVIVKRCVDRHGGSIGFESREREGTTFTVRLPLYGRNGSGGATANGASAFPAPLRSHESP